VGEVLLIGIPGVGATPQTRMRGVLTGINETLRLPESLPVIHLDGRGAFKVALELVRKHLQTSRAKRVLVGAANDPIALGALRAFDEAGRAHECAVASQNCEPDARVEMRRPGTRLIGSVAYFPEKYGDALVRLALDILARKPTPPAVFVKHQLVTPENVDDIYPNDSLLGLQEREDVSTPIRKRK